jgi:hypothetical protein
LSLRNGRFATVASEIHEYAEEVIGSVEADSDYLQEIYSIGRFFDFAMHSPGTPPPLALECVQVCAALYGDKEECSDEILERWVTESLRAAAGLLQRYADGEGTIADPETALDMIQAVSDPESTGSQYHTWVCSNGHPIVGRALDAAKTAAAGSRGAESASAVLAERLMGRIVDAQALFASP